MNPNHTVRIQKDPEIDPCLYGQLVFDEEAKGMLWGKDNLHNCAETTGRPN